MGNSESKINTPKEFSADYEMPKELDDKIKKSFQYEESRVKRIKERLNKDQKSLSFEELLEIWSEFIGSPSLDAFVKFIENMHESTIRILQYRFEIKSTIGETKYQEFMQLLTDHWTLLGKTENVIKLTKETAQNQHDNIIEILSLLDKKDNNVNKEELIEEYKDRMQLLTVWIEEEQIKQIKDEWTVMKNRLQQMYDYWVSTFKQTWYSWAKYVLTALITGISCALASLSVMGVGLITMDNSSMMNGKYNEKEMFEHLMSTIKDPLTQSFIINHTQTVTMGLTGLALVQFAYSFYKGYRAFQTVINDANKIQSSLHDMLKHAYNMENTLNALQLQIGKDKLIDNYISRNKNLKSLVMMKQSLNKLKEYLMELINQSEMLIIQVGDSKNNILNQLLD